MSAACIAACNAATMAASNAALMAARNASRTATVNARRRREAQLYEFCNNKYTPPQPKEEERSDIGGKVLIGVLVSLVILAGVSLVWVTVS